MKGSRERQQKTSEEGLSVDNRMEAEGIRKAPSIPMAPAKETSSAETENLLEAILSRDNLLEALKRVERNKGSYGVDGMKVEELRAYLIENWETIKRSILDGTYRPLPVRRVEIPKPDGGKRLLGIPTVLDRFIQQAISQILTQVFDPHFSESSFDKESTRRSERIHK